MSRRKPLPSAIQAVPFRVSTARAAGVSRVRLAAADLDAPFHGARSPAGQSVARALVPLLSPGQALTGPTAAALWDLPLPLKFLRDPSVHVSSLAPTVAMRRPGVVGSQRAAGDAVLLDGLPVVTPPRAWVSLAPMLSEWDLVAVADRLISGTMKTPPLCSRADLARELARARGARGASRLRRALDMSRVGSWSRPETLLRLLIAAAQLPEPHLNEPLNIDDGPMVIPDLSWPDYRVAVEYDGRWHDTGWQPVRDSERHERFVDAEWTVVHARADDVFDRPSALVARLIRRLRAAGAPTRAVDLARIPAFQR